jgi:hypothetical protein
MGYSLILGKTPLGDLRVNTGLIRGFPRQIVAQPVARERLSESR